MPYIESLMIGDNIEADVFGALDQVFQLFYLIIKNTSPNGIKTIDNLIELKVLL